MPVPRRRDPRSRRPFALAFALVAALLPTAARADAPEIGDDAPPLAVDRWIKGQPLENFDRGRVYVVDFFAADCGACRTTIPHLNALAERFPDAVFVGIATGVGDTAQRLAPLVDLARYRVAVDRHSIAGGAGLGEMFQRWIVDTRFAVRLPVTFLIDADGQIAWAGSPMRVDEPLKQVMAGTYDLRPELAKAQAARAKRERREKATTELREAVATARPPINKRADLVPLQEKIFGKYPETADLAAAARFRRLMLAKDYDAAYRAADEWAAAADEDSQQLNELAWYIVDEADVEQRDLARARRYAERAVELSDGINAAIVDTLAKAIFLQGDVARAIELQSRALELADADDKEQLRGTLAVYRAAAATRPSPAAR